MAMKPDIAVRISADLVDEAEALAKDPAALEEFRVLAGGTLARTHIIRLALALGLTELRRRAVPRVPA